MLKVEKFVARADEERKSNTPQSATYPFPVLVCTRYEFLCKATPTRPRIRTCDVESNFSSTFKGRPLTCETPEKSESFFSRESTLVTPRRLHRVEN